MSKLLEMFKKKETYQSKVEYRNPDYLVATTKKKYGDNIFVLGATFKELIGFWDSVEKNVISIGHPYEKGRTVVDIDSKCHINNSEVMDEIQITSSKTSKEQKTSSTSYELQLMKGRTTQVGGNMRFKVGGPSFFNQASGGITAGVTITDTKTETHSKSNTHSQSLAQTYGIIEDLKVPAKTKIKAMIKTWGVTYKADTVAKLSVDAKATIYVYYRPWYSRRFLGGLIKKKGKITAEELFEGEDNYEVIDDILTFTRKGELSYLSEEVEVIKESSSLAAAY